MATRKPKELTYKVQILNIKLLSNDRKGSSAYEDIIKGIHQNKISIPVISNTHMILRTMFKDVVDVNGVGVQILYGKVSKYTVIDGKDWINLNNMEVENIDLPANIFPNLKESEYIFIPEAHRLAIINKDSISVRHVEKFLRGAIKEVVKPTEEFEVCIEQADDAFERITKAEQILKLHIDISYSNADVGDDAYEFMDNQLRNGEVGRLKMDISPNHNKNINTNGTVINGSLKVAQSNGSAQATIIEGGKRIVVDTKEHPRTIVIKCAETLMKLKVVNHIINLFRPQSNERNQ